MRFLIMLKRADSSDKTHDCLRSFNKLLATFVRNAAGKWESSHFAIVASKIIVIADVIAELEVIWDSVNRLVDEQAFIDRDEIDLEIDIEEEEEDETVEEKEAKKVRFMDARELE